MVPPQVFDVADLGPRICQARKAMGLRQDEFAAAASVGLRFLVELERGKPTVQLGKALAVLVRLVWTSGSSSAAPYSRQQGLPSGRIAPRGRLERAWPI